MALMFRRRLRRRAATCCVVVLILYYMLRVDYCLRCFYSHRFERPKCHHVYSRNALLGGPVVCMERHWSRAMHQTSGFLSITNSFAFDRAVAIGLRNPSDEVAELGFNRTEMAQQVQLKQGRRNWPLLPAKTVDPPAAAIAAGLRYIEPTFTFVSSGDTGDVQWPKQCIELRYGLFIPHHHTSGLSTTIAAIGSATAFGADRIYVVDTSTDESAANSPALAALGVQVLRPAHGVPLPYVLLHEFIRREAIATNLDFYFYMHTDVTLGRGVVSEALRGLCVSVCLLRHCCGVIGQVVVPRLDRKLYTIVNVLTCDF